MPARALSRIAAARGGPTDKLFFAFTERPKGFEFRLTVRFDLLYGLEPGTPQGLSQTRNFGAGGDMKIFGLLFVLFSFSRDYATAQTP